MHIYRLITILVIGGYLLSPIVIDSWDNSNKIWYLPFVIWLLVILFSAWIECRSGRDEL